MRTDCQASTAGLPTFSTDKAGEDELPPVFGCDRLAQFLVVDIKTVQGLAQRGEIPCRKVGKAYRFYRPAVLAWLLGPQRSRSGQR